MDRHHHSGTTREKVTEFWAKRERDANSLIDKVCFHLKNLWLSNVYLPSPHRCRVWLENGNYSLCVCVCLEAIASHNHPVHDRITGVSSELVGMTIIWMSDLVNWFWVSWDKKCFELACPLVLGGVSLAAGLLATSRIMGQAMLEARMMWAKSQDHAVILTGLGSGLVSLLALWPQVNCSSFLAGIHFLICKIKC